MSKIKTFFLLLVVFLLIGGCIAQLCYVRSVTDSLLKLSGRLCGEVLGKQWDSAEKTFSELCRLWETHSAILCSLVKHSYIDSIGIELRAFSADLAAQNYQNMPSAAARLFECIRILAHTERISFPNFL